MKRPMWLGEWLEAPTVVLCAATALLVVSHYQGSTGWFSVHLAGDFAKTPYRETLPYFWWFASSILLYLALPLALTRLGGLPRPNELGLGVGDIRLGLRWSGALLLVMAPVVYLATKTSFFHGAYPLVGDGAYTWKPVDGAPVRHSWGLFALYEAGYMGYFIAWEFFFRGWMLNALWPAFERRAVLIQMLPFALMHLGKPEPEAFGSIIAGLALGVLAVRTRSFWYGALVHGGVALWMDILSSPLLG